jgi:hypothetical protein
MTINEVDKLEAEIDSDGEDVVKRKDGGGDPSEAALSKMEDFGRCQPDLWLYVC